jgi:hypothetical protein
MRRLPQEEKAKMRTESILYKELASAIDARKRCKETGNAEWFERHSETIEQLVADFLPSGSGWDCGTKIDLEASHADFIELFGEFHHMNDGGMYDGWTAHSIIVTPSLLNGFNLRISGRNRNEIKDDLHEMFDVRLRQEIIWSEEEQRWIVACQRQTGCE